MKHKKKTIYLNKTEPGISVKRWMRIKLWLDFVAVSEGYEIKLLTYSLITDSDMLKMNREKLKHDYYTDIITYDLGEGNNRIEGDIYISFERVEENAQKFHVKRMDEMRRVFLHGLLHLLGYNDKTKKEKEVMKGKEEYYLEKYYKLFHKKE